MDFSVNTVRPTFKQNEKGQLALSLYFSDFLPEEVLPIVEFVNESARTTSENTLTISVPLTELLEFETDVRSCWGDAKLYCPQDKPLFDSIKRELLALVAQIDSFTYESDAPSTTAV